MESKGNGSGYEENKVEDEKREFLTSKLLFSIQ